MNPSVTDLQSVCDWEKASVGRLGCLGPNRVQRFFIYSAPSYYYFEVRTTSSTTLLQYYSIIIKTIDSDENLERGLVASFGVTVSVVVLVRILSTERSSK
jgi:hypothetical protein